LTLNPHKQFALISQVILTQIVVLNKMAIKRLLRGKSALRLNCKKFTKNVRKSKSNDMFVAAIYLSYLKFLQKLMAESSLNAHEKRDKTLQTEHIKLASKATILRPIGL